MYQGQQGSTGERGKDVKVSVHRHTPVLSLSKGRPTPTMG